MCYVVTGKDIMSTTDLQVLITDTIYEQTSPFTFESLKKHINAVAQSNGGCGLQNIEKLTETLLYETLQQFILKKLVVTVEDRCLKYVE